MIVAAHLVMALIVPAAAWAVSGNWLVGLVAAVAMAWITAWLLLLRESVRRTDDNLRKIARLK